MSGAAASANTKKANHCSGAVMFLIDDSTKAILYTGDIRGKYQILGRNLRAEVVS